ncbi:hypothetical protein OPV22_033853 [Ensete ventricosum]|uniref:DUF4005 domain-containing protein n=1 Tax=Ensete ventricosum TaxID=4639 RepID=A0AAV8PZF3_ENSVE|nr:hypothetical protein OPV22_033853 [Ensete ventricosum]
MGVSSNSTITKSSSMDFSDPTALCPPRKEGPEPPEQRVQQKGADPKPHDHFSWQQQECGKRFGEILSRTCSSSSQRFRAEVIRGSSSTTLQAGIRRAFSMRKSSSAREGYWRIHDTGDGDQLMEEQQQQTRRSKKKGKLLRACKRLFGF